VRALNPLLPPAASGRRQGAGTAGAARPPALRGYRPPGGCRAPRDGPRAATAVRRRRPETFPCRTAEERPFPAGLPGWSR
jgi:hypothetical protein